MVPPSLHQLIRTWKEATTPNLSPLRQLGNSKRPFSVSTNFLNDYCLPPSTAINRHHRNRWEMVPPSLHQLIGTWKEATTPNLSPLRQLENSKHTFSVLTNFLNYYRLPPSTAITETVGKLYRHHFTSWSGHEKKLPNQISALYDNYRFQEALFQF